MRVCIALFGLNRSLPWTHKSIIDNLITPLREYGAQVKGGFKSEVQHPGFQ